MRTQKGKKCSCTLSSTAALDVAGWSVPRPGRCAPVNTLCPLYRRLNGPRDRFGRIRKIFPPPGLEPWIVQPVAIALSRQPVLFCTDVETSHFKVGAYTGERDVEEKLETKWQEVTGEMRSVQSQTLRTWKRNAFCRAIGILRCTVSGWMSKQ